MQCNSKETLEVGMPRVKSCYSLRMLIFALLQLVEKLKFGRLSLETSNIRKKVKLKDSSGKL